MAQVSAKADDGSSAQPSTAPKTESRHIPIICLPPLSASERGQSHPPIAAWWHPRAGTPGRQARLHHDRTFGAARSERAANHSNPDVPANGGLRGVTVALVGPAAHADGGFPKRSPGSISRNSIASPAFGAAAVRHVQRVPADALV